MDDENTTQAPAADLNIAPAAPKTKTYKVKEGVVYRTVAGRLSRNYIEVQGQRRYVIATTGSRTDKDGNTVE